MKTIKPESKIINILLAGIINFSGSAMAYDATDDADVTKERSATDYQQQGIRAGSFTILPKMELKNEYISNLYYKQSNVNDSYIAHYKPGLNVNSNWSRNALNLAIDSDLTQYTFQADRNDYQNVNTQLSGRFDTVRDSHFDSSFAYNKLTENRGSPDQISALTPTFYDTKVIDNFYKHQFNRISTKLGLNATRFDYDDVLTGSTPSTTLEMSSRNRWMYTPEIRLGYFIQPQYEAFVKFEYKEAAYDTLVKANGNGGAVNRNSTGYNATTGLAFDLTDLVTGDVSVGYIERKYESSLLKTISGVNGFLNLKWRPTAITTVNGGVFRNINETTQLGVAGIFSTGVNLGVEHELKRNVQLHAGGNFNYLDYNNYTAAAARTDNMYGANVGTKYLVNRHFNADLSYTYQNRDASVVNANYDINQVMLNLRAQY